MTKVQSVDRNVSFLFVGDVNAHHVGWPMTFTTNLHGRVTLPHHRVVSRWLRSLHTLMKVLDLVLTDVLDIVGFRVGSPVETLDHRAVL